jgi:hypothetical protein
MRFRLLCTTLVAVPVIAGLAAPARQDVVQKTALVTVIAEARGPVANLGPRDLVVREDRATRDVLDVRPATEPLFVALLIDTIRPPAGAPTSPVGVTMAATPDYRRGLAAFVSTIKGGNPDAQIAILEYAGATVTAIDFTSEAPTLDRFIQRLFPNRQADAVLIEAVVEGAKKLGDKPSPRRAIVVVDFNSRDSSAVPAMQQAAEIVNKSGATVWTVSVRSTSASSSHREDVLNVVTRLSGGTRLTIVQPTGLEAMLKSVANSLLSQYTVTFARPVNATVKSTEMETAKGGKVLLTPWMR